MIGKIINTQELDIYIRGIDGNIYFYKNGARSFGAIKNHTVSFPSYMSGNKFYTNKMTIMHPNRSNNVSIMRKINFDWREDGKVENINYIYWREDFNKIIDGDVFLILGRKGSGKSAIAKYIKYHCAKRKLYSPIEVKFSNEILGEMINVIGGIFHENKSFHGLGDFHRTELLKSVWFYYVVSKVVGEIVEKNKSNKNVLDILKNNRIELESLGDVNFHGGFGRLLKNSIGLIARAIGGATGAAVGGDAGAMLGIAAGGIAGKSLENLGECVGEKLVDSLELDDKKQKSINDSDNIIDANKRLGEVLRKLINEVDVNSCLYVIFDELDYPYTDAGNDFYIEAIFSLIRFSEEFSDSYSFEDICSGAVDRKIRPVILLRDDIFSIVKNRIKMKNDIHKWDDKSLTLNWTWNDLMNMIGYKLWISAGKSADKYNEGYFDEVWVNLFKDDIVTTFNGRVSDFISAEEHDGEIYSGFNAEFVYSNNKNKKYNSILHKIYENSNRVPRDYVSAVKIAVAQANSERKEFVDVSSFEKSSAEYSKKFYDRIISELSAEIYNLQEILSLIKSEVKKSNDKKYKFEFNGLKSTIANRFQLDDSGAFDIMKKLYNFSIISNIVQNKFYPIYNPGGEFSPDREIVLHKGLWLYMDA